jgi:hypothetical protein
VIRQAISCDICGAEKKQTNHWFVASEQAGELRVSGWTSRNRLRAGTKHLCGQTCLHKLMDEFVARTIAGRNATPAPEAASLTETRPATDASLTSRTAYLEPQASANAAAKPAAIAPLKPAVVAATMVLPIQVLPIQPRISAEEPCALQLEPCIEETPNYASRRWRAEAWERERALHTVERRNESGGRHRKTL